MYQPTVQILVLVISQYKKFNPSHIQIFMQFIHCQRLFCLDISIKCLLYDKVKFSCLTINLTFSETTAITVIKNWMQEGLI